MGKAYSVDLRLRVLSALDGGMSKLCAHHTFQVSRTTIDDWLRLREETGSLAVKAPLPSGGPAIRDLVAFEEFATRHSASFENDKRTDITELVQQLVSGCAVR